jgi:hypothetical protein
MTKVRQTVEDAENLCIFFQKDTNAIDSCFHNTTSHRGFKMAALSNEEHRIIHSEAPRFLSRIELETAARIARQAAQMGFLAAVKAMEESPVAASDVHRFFPNLNGSKAQPGQWVVTITDADQVLVTRRLEPGAEPLTVRGYQQVLRSCARTLLDLAGVAPRVRRRLQ